MFSIPLSIGFFPIVEFVVLELRLIPRLAIPSASAWFSHRPVCVIRSFLYIFFILLALPCVGVLARANLTFFSLVVVGFLGRQSLLLSRECSRVVLFYLSFRT